MKILTFLMLFSCTILFSQDSVDPKSTDQSIAYEYFLNGQYEKAIIIYKQLNKRGVSARYYYPYFNSHFNLSQYSEAEKIAFKMYRRSPKNLTYLVEVSVCQLKQNKIKKFNKTFSEILKKITENKSQAINLANTFNRFQFYKQSLKIYEKSESINTQNDFSYQKAQLYGLVGESEKMIDAYLDILEKNPTQKQLVTINIQRFLDNDGIASEKNYQLIKKRLLRKSQAEKERTDFSEMLIWLFMQNHEFRLAFIQAKGVDKRIRGDGQQIYDLAEIFLKNEYYSLAIEAYDYIIDKKQQNRLSILAHTDRLFALRSKKDIDVSFVDQEYQKTIKELGYTNQTINLIVGYAHFKAFLKYDLLSASKILEEAMKIAGVGKVDLAICKIEYADIMLLSGKIWEALLFYSQIEKEFKEHPIGHEAKFKRAKAAYYQGDFDWAHAQLEILKASTSKLIANDAMELSLLISDNLNLDTTESAMKAFAKAELLFFQNKIDQALMKYDSILVTFYGHSLSDEIYFRKAIIYQKMKNFESAIEMLDKIRTEFYYDILSDDAAFSLARIYDYSLGDKEKAMEFYEKIMLEYKGSIYIPESRKRYRYLRGDDMKKIENDHI